MRRVLLRLAAVAVLAFGLPLVWFTPAGAEAPDDKGWWFKGNVGDPTGVLSGAGVKIVPPNVPEDGLYVANDPTGPAGVSALRFHLADAPAATVTLTVAGSGSAIEAAVVACPATTNWIGADGGPWAQRAQADCDAAQVPGDAGEDGTTMTWQIPADFATDGTYSVVLLPDPTTMEPFQMPFEPPDESTIAPAGGGSGAGSSAPPPSDFSAEDFGTTFAAAGETPSTSAGSDFETPSAGPSVPDSAGQGQQAAQTPPQQQLPVATSSRGVSATDPVRWVATGLLAAIAIGMWVLSGRQVPTPRLLGGLGASAAAGDAAEASRRASSRPATPVVGGIGRFRGPRTVRPTRI